MNKDRRRGLGVGFRMTLAAIIATTMLGSFATAASAIVGGDVVTYPWAAAFITPDDGRPLQERFYCSGALIKARWVLTAGHCRPATGDTVTIGRGLLSAAGERREVLEVHYLFHEPTYCESRSESECDLALVMLDRSSNQADLDLADAAVLPEWGVGTSARAYGYGQIEAGPRGGEWRGHLKRANVRIDDFRDNHYTMWASDPGNEDAFCWGDSGGPLIVSTSRGARVVGVVRAILERDESSPCDPGDTQSYTKVGFRGSFGNSPAFHWIANTI